MYIMGNKNIRRCAMKRTLFTLSFPRKWESSILFVILFALFFNTKTTAQIDTTTNVGGWKIVEHHNLSSLLIFQDTAKMQGNDLRTRGYVEGKGSLRLQFVSSKPNTQTAQAGLTIVKTFTISCFGNLSLPTHCR